MVEHIFLSPQVKRGFIISNKLTGIYELLHNFTAGGAFVPTQEKKKKDLES